MCQLWNPYASSITFYGIMEIIKKWIVRDEKSRKFNFLFNVKRKNTKQKFNLPIRIESQYSMPCIMVSFYFIFSLLFILSVKMKTTNLYIIFYFYYSSFIFSNDYFGQEIKIFLIFFRFSFVRSANTIN